MKKIIFIGGLLLVSVQLTAQSIAPSTTKNYIYTKDCLDADCTKKAESVQYFDGMGRSKQIVAIKASPSQKDVVTHIDYDQYGRPTKSYLPVPQTGTQNGAIYDNPLNNAVNPDIYGAEKIYSEQIIENAPLDRVKQSFGTGNAWSNKPVNYSYNTNTLTNEVKKYTIFTTWVENRTESRLDFSGYYSVNNLIKTSVSDEDENTTIEYKNGKGQTVLIRKNDGTKDVDTYYVYNEYNQLAYVIPPLASVSTTISPSALNNLCYQYRYDDLGRLVEKKIPGKGWEYMVYDKQDRLVLTQDVILGTVNNSFNKKGWMFIKYDKFGRVVYTGFFGSTSTRSTLQTQINTLSTNLVNNEDRSTTPFTLSGMDVYYTKSAFPTTGMTLLSVSYYDTYPLGTPAISSPILGQDVLSQDAQNSSISTKSLPTASYIKNIEDDNWTKSFVWYDTKARPIGSHSINHLGGYTKTETLLDFAGVPQKTNTYHLRKTGESGVTVKERFVYDPQNRLIQHFHQVDDKAEELLTENTYNELSQVKNKKVGNNLQSIDYAYNIRGWLTDINKDQMGVANLGGKLFSYKIKYNQKQGIENPDTVLFPNKNVKANYNGNIAEVDWRTVETIGVNPSMTPKRYGYAYDKLNRLSAGYYQNPNNAYSKENTESLDYDLNGNISKLYRTSVIQSGNPATVIDKLEYIYSGGDNKVTNIKDLSNNPTGYQGGGNIISYDLNGNMIDMPDKGIDVIKYNYLNLSNSVHLNRNGIEDISINTKYSADGTKLRKENITTITNFTGFTTVKTTIDYLDGFQYSKVESPNTGGGGDPEMLSSLMMSKRAMQPEAFSIDEEKTSSAASLKTDDLLFFPTSEGFYDYIKDQYIYQYFDHLGNVRLSFARNSAGGLEITDSNDYYPFGMNHLKTGNSFFSPSAYKSYKFGSKELQEFGAYDFGARIYMADIGRWTASDPMAEQNPSLTPYRYGFNNPIMFTDPNGMLEQALIDRMWSLGATTWYNTGDGLESESNIKLGYDGSYLSLNTSLDPQGGGGGGTNSSGEAYINIPAINLIGEHFKWGQAFQDTFNAYMSKWNGDDGAYGAIQNFTSYIANSLGGLIGTTNEKFFSFSGGTNDPDKETLNKLRPRDEIEANNMFEYILNGYGRAFKLVNVRPDRFQLGIDMASLSSLSYGLNYNQNSMDVKVTSLDSIKYTGFTRQKDTTIFYGDNYGDLDRAYKPVLDSSYNRDIRNFNSRVPSKYRINKRR